MYNYFIYDNPTGAEKYIYRLPDGACIPMDENNGDYRNYLVWAKNNTAKIISSIREAQNQ